MAMNSISQVITEIVNHQLFPVAAIILAAGVAILVSKRKNSHSLLKFTSHNCLDGLGLQQLSNVKCPDGLGQYFTIDRMILRSDGISLLIYKKYPGKIFCADHIEEWTQMLEQKSYTFKNPLFELDDKIKALSACLPDIPVNGYLFFDHKTEFPKGHPERVIHPQAIPEELDKNNRHKVNKTVMKAWNGVLSLKKKK